MPAQTTHFSVWWHIVFLIFDNGDGLAALIGGLSGLVLGGSIMAVVIYDRNYLEDIRRDDCLELWRLSECERIVKENQQKDKNIN